MDIRNYDDVTLMVNEFYRRVKEDELLGPVFMEKIPGDWEPHLQILRKFWYTVLFGEPGYMGNPFMKHTSLPIDKDHFDRWIKLFYQTIDDLFSGERAEDAKLRAGRMSLLFQTKLADMRQNNMKPLM